MSRSSKSALPTALPFQTSLAGPLAPVGRPAAAISDSGRDRLQQYQIEVRAQGKLIADHVVLAANALEAINLVESEYGEPLQVETVEIEAGPKRRCQVMVARHWHGYSFDARVMRP